MDTPIVFQDLHCDCLGTISHSQDPNPLLIMRSVNRAFESLSYTRSHVSFQTSWVFTWRVSAHISFHTTTECNTRIDWFVNKHYSKICQILLHQDKVHAGCFPTSALQIGPAHSLAGCLQRDYRDVDDDDTGLMDGKAGREWGSKERGAIINMIHLLYDCIM